MSCNAEKFSLNISIIVTDVAYLPISFVLKLSAYLSFKNVVEEFHIHKGNYEKIVFS